MKPEAMEVSVTIVRCSIMYESLVANFRHVNWAEIFVLLCAVTRLYWKPERTSIPGQAGCQEPISTAETIGMQNKGGHVSYPRPLFCPCENECLSTTLYHHVVPSMPSRTEGNYIECDKILTVEFYFTSKASRSLRKGSSNEHFPWKVSMCRQLIDAI